MPFVEPERSVRIASVACFSRLAASRHVGASARRDRVRARRSAVGGGLGGLDPGVGVVFGAVDAPHPPPSCSRCVSHATNRCRGLLRAGGCARADERIAQRFELGSQPGTHGRHRDDVFGPSLLLGDASLGLELAQDALARRPDELDVRAADVELVGHLGDGQAAEEIARIADLRC